MVHAGRPLDALIPIQAKPLQGIDDLIEGFLGVATRIGVFNAENESSPT